MKEKKELINCQKFIWETYKILLDITKTNSKLLTLYSKILIAAFNFCRTNRRRIEFKRLCDSVRGYLQTLIKTEKKQLTIINKVDISKPQVLKILIDIRLSLLETATDLEQWQEAFKTAEDLVFLMDKYEKIPSAENPKKNLKISIQKKIDFYANIEKLLWISDYTLYNAYASILVKDLGVRMNKTYNDILTSTQSKSKVETYRKYCEQFTQKYCNDRIILATLSCSVKNQYTNFLKLGEELFDNNQEKEIESETCNRMMTILKLNSIPSRQSLITFIESNNILDISSPTIRELYNLFQKEENPFKFAKHGFDLITMIERENPGYQQYSKLLRENLIVKCLLKFSKIYDSINFERLAKILPNVTFKEIENIIIENSRLGILTCLIDYNQNIILFKNLNYYNMNVSEHLNNLTKKIYSIGKAILTEDKNIVKNLNLLKNSVFNSLRKLQENGKILTDERLSKISKTIENLAKYHKEKEDEKAKRKEEKNKEKQKNQIEEEENLKKAMKLLKDEEAKKELQRELKKHLLDKLKSYTNIIELKGVKYRIDDLVKDLDKIEDNEVLVQILEKEEVDYKTQKEKKINKTIKEKDYITRELREREYKAFFEVMIKEEKNYLEELENKDKEFYQNYIPIKADLLTYNNNIDLFFNGKLKEIEDDHNRQMEAYRISKLDKLKKEIDTFANTSFLNTIESAIKKWKAAEKAEKERDSKREEEKKTEKVPDGFFRKHVDSTIEPPKVVTKDETKNQNLSDLRGKAYKEDKLKEEPKEVLSSKIIFQRGTETAKDTLIKPVFKDDKEKPAVAKETPSTSTFSRKEETKIEKNVPTTKTDLGFSRKTEETTPITRNKVEEKPAEKNVITRGDFGKKTEEKPAEKTTSTTITRGGDFAKKPAEETKEKPAEKTTSTTITRGGDFAKKPAEETKEKPAEKTTSTTITRGGDFSKKPAEEKPATISRGIDTTKKPAEENKQASSSNTGGFQRKAPETKKK
jgi:translation initiation factor 3 subunit A